MSSVAQQSPAAPESRLAVNVAFLREVKGEDEGFLFDLLQAARDSMDALTLRRLNDRALVDLLRSVKDRLAERFSMEESLGYFKDAVDFPPELYQEAANCRQEHESLYLAVCEIVDVAERLLYQDSSCLRERAIQRITISFGCFYRRLKHHERCEDQLADRFSVFHAEGQSSSTR